MKSDENAMSGRARRSRSMRAQIVGAGVAAVHRLEDAVGAGLHRQMQLRHQRRQVAVRGDEIVVHVARMAGAVAQPRDAGNVREPLHQPAERRGAAVRVLAVIGVDVLAEQRDLADAGIGQTLRLGDDLGDRPRHLGAARIGHDAEGAELVAAFLHGDEGRHAALADRGAARRGEMAELVLDRKLRVDDLAVRGARQHLRQPVIALRPDHEIDPGRAAEDLLAFGLRDAAGDGDCHVAALASRRPPSARACGRARNRPSRPPSRGCGRC